MLSVNRRTASDLESFWAPIPAGRAGLAAGIIALIVYVSGLSPLVHTFDPAQFQTMARTGGIAHSGYPTVGLLLQLFGLLPFGTLAWKANLLSACSGAVVVGLLAYTATRFTRRPLASAVAALAFALSLSAWKESSLAGVHMFTLAIGGMLFLLALRYVWWPSLRDATGAAFLFGLGLTSHLTVLGLAPVLLLAFSHGIRRSAYRTRHVFAAVLALACGLVPFAMTIRSDRTDQPMNYLADTLDPGPLVPEHGEPTLALRVERLIWLVRGEQYLGSLPHDTVTLARLGQNLVIDQCVNEFPFVTFPIAWLGLFGWFLRSRGLARWWLPWIAMTTVLTLFAASPYTARFFFLPGAYVLAIGLAFALASIERRRAPLAWALMALVLAMPFVRLALPDPPGFVASSPMVARIWPLWPQAWRPWHAERHYDEYGRGVMARLPEKAVVLGMGWDESTTLRYFVHGEVLRPDVSVLYTGPANPRLARHYDAAIAAGRPVFTTERLVPDALPGVEAIPVWDSGWKALWRLEQAAPESAVDTVSVSPDSSSAH